MSLNKKGDWSVQKVIEVVLVILVIIALIAIGVMVYKNAAGGGYIGGPSLPPRIQ
jgi:hypothetical protein